MTTRFGVFAFLGLIAGVVAICLRVRDLRHSRRERGLEKAVRERTEELERERLRETSRSRILEMMLSNEPLGAVLDHVADLVTAETPGSICAILLRQRERIHVATAPGAPAGMVEALQAPHALPFEVWKGAAEFFSPAIDSAWKGFFGRLTGPAPSVIRSRPIGTSGQPLGALVVFDREVPSPEAARVLEDAPRLARIAIEHSRFYDHLNFQAHHDNLTGLPNRALFERRLAEAVYEAKNANRRAAVLSIDLDRFKQINDTMGHRIGDLFLANVADRLRRTIRPGDTVGRIGGDEFCIILGNIAAAAEAEAVADRLLSVARQPVIIEGRSLIASVSIGVAVYPDDGLEAEELERDADAALYCAKGLGRDRVQVFSTHNIALDRVRMGQELKRALRDRLYTVHYQPKVDADGGFAGMEALVRLNHPELGQIPPNDFIPMAEESGLIIPLGAWVLDEVCRQIIAWKDVGLGLLPVAVNVSPVQICRPDFAADVEECLRRRGVPPQFIELELTESLLIGSGEETQKQMRYLRSLGIRFSIDDFGTGYSSLSYLHRLQVDAIKLDRSFVKSIDTDDAARRLVQAMIGVAEGLGLSVIAEGVETEAQRQVLIAAGCPTMQGYLFSRPQPADEMERYLRRSRASVSDDLRRIEKAVLHDLAPLEVVGGV